MRVDKPTFTNAFDDDTAGDVSITAHGLTPKAPNDTSKYLRGDGTWATVTASGTDANAVHVNAGSEISAIAEKTAPIAADMMIIEDSASSNAKKMVKLENAGLALGAIYTKAGQIELGRMGTGDRDSYIDFVASGTPGAVDYSAKIIRASGANGHLDIIQTGTGDLTIIDAAGNYIEFRSTGVYIRDEVNDNYITMDSSYININGNITIAR